MSVTLRVVHRTGYTYNGPATASYNETRMVPQSSLDQTVLHTRTEITPTPWQDHWTDYYGNSVTTFELHEPHEELKVVAISTVIVERKPPMGDGHTWADITADWVVDNLAEFLAQTDRTEPDPQLLEVAAQLRAQCEHPTDFVAGIIDRTRQHVEFRPGRFGATNLASDMWGEGAGGSQDMAHIVIGALRSQGVPARYVTGYLMSEPDAPAGEVVQARMQAWVQWWDGAWVAVDPTTGKAPDDYYVEVAHGRDYSDVVPLRGIFTGTPGSKMFATVEISRIV